MPIYTRKGDKGETSLFDGTRVSKFHPRVETYGTIDELNSMLGAVLSQLRTKNKKLRTELERIQHDLLKIGSSLANPRPLSVLGLSKRPADFEKLIDKMTEKMPVLKNFILPGGGKAGSLLHVARTITRRAERQLVKLMQKDASAGSAQEYIDEQIVIYLNRLSDLLFTMARYVNHLEKKKETKWNKK
jgi:cob(I)alamin adenosyltransferase